MVQGREKAQATGRNLPVRDVQVVSYQGLLSLGCEREGWVGGSRKAGNSWTGNSFRTGSGRIELRKVADATTTTQEPFRYVVSETGRLS